MDRTPKNPNLMVRGSEVWLVDHGASLTFHHRWRDVSEDTPRDPGDFVSKHLFASAHVKLASWDEPLANMVSREVLERAVAAVPDEFLLPLLERRGRPPDTGRER